MAMVKVEWLILVAARLRSVKMDGGLFLLVVEKHVKGKSRRRRRGAQF
jgi:hypothetical protein